MALAKDLIGLGVPPGQAQGLGGQGATALTATGSNQATALALVASNNMVGTAAASTGVILPAVQAGESVYVYNGGASTLAVYPPLGAQINSGATNAAFTLATTVGGKFKFVTNLNIIAMRSA